MNEIQTENGGGRTETIAPFLAQIAGRGIGIPEAEFNALKELLSAGENKGDIDARSEVNAYQLIHIARAREMATHYKWKTLESFVTNILTLSLSLNRKSRIEFAHAVRAAASGGIDEQMGWAEKMMNNIRG